MTTTDQTPEPGEEATKRWSIEDDPGDVTRFTLTDPEAAKYRLEFSSPGEPLLKLTRTPDGKVHAEYDPGNVTAAAQALINELARIQQPIPLPVPTTDGLAAIEARLRADKVHDLGTDQCVRDRDALLAMVREQRARLDAVKDLAEYWERTPALRRVSAASKIRAALTATEGL